MMVLIAIVSLLLGIACGHFLIPESWSSVLSQISEIVLWMLMFAVGISVGLNKLIFRKIREYHLKILLIPIGITVGSILGGILCGLLLPHLPIGQAAATAVGMGWYSLSGVLLQDLCGGDAGALAFLSNLMREVFAFLTIPFLAKYCNHYTAIAPAGATSEDTTLPMFVKYTREEVVVMALINGVLCSAVVPFLTPILYELLSI